MKAMILAAGVGSRLDPLTRNVPKPMVPVLNRPVMEHIVEMLGRNGFTDIMVNVHYLGDQIQAYFGDGSKWGVKISYSVEDQLWGDAGSVKRCESFLRDDVFAVVGGDDLADFDLESLVSFHRDNEAIATLALSLVEDPSQYGIALLNDRGRITRFLEKPKAANLFSNSANTGVYIFHPRIFDLIPEGEKFGFGNNLFPILQDENARFFGKFAFGYWKDVGSLKQYQEAHVDALRGRWDCKIPFTEDPDRDQVWVGENVEIDPSAKIGCPVVIGNNCRIEKNAQLLKNSVLADNCVVEMGSVVRQSILWEGACVMRNTVIERCVVGDHCSVKSSAAVFDGVIVDPVRRNGNGG